MYTTLYSLLKPLISGAHTGIVTIVSDYGSIGKIYLKSGCIVGAKAGNLTGGSAANELAKWVSISAEFTAQLEANIVSPDAFDHMGFVKLLAGMDKMIHTIRNVIPGNDAKFKFLVDNWQEKTVSMKQLVLITKLDGHRTVRQVVDESGVAEFEVLIFIHSLFNNGLAKKVNSTGAMKKEDIDDFLEVLRNKLLDLVGPAADATIQKAFESLGIDPDCLTQSQIAYVFDSVAEHLDEMESEVFNHWKNRYYTELRNVG